MESKSELTKFALLTVVGIEKISKEKDKKKKIKIYIWVTFEFTPWSSGRLSMSPDLSNILLFKKSISHHFLLFHYSLLGISYFSGI
jgi:hypothetical protein